MLGKRLAELRNKKGLSQYELANRLGFSRGKLANYEQGSRQPDYETLDIIADFFNVSTDYLLGRVENPELKNKVTVTGQGNDLTADEEFEAFANNPDLERWYKDLPNSEEEDLEALKQIWETIKRVKK